MSDKRVYARLRRAMAKSGLFVRGQTPDIASLIRATILGNSTWRTRQHDDYLEDNHENAMLAGAVLGGAAIQALHAQAKPPVYMIAINQVRNPDGYAKEYVPPAQKSVKDYGGEYIAAGPGMQIEGNLPDGAVIILRWENVEALQRWRNSPEFQAALKIGEQYAKFNIIAVNGIKQ
jgi:uncharacterized protein (DUF1330 family)